MEIKRLGENKIRCALTEEEIKDMGFEIDEIIGNGDTTQQFMRLVLSLVEEQENINIENISPMVKAELLSDHSMAITFGGDSDLSFKDLMNTINQLMGQMTPEKMEEFKNLSREEKQDMVDAFLEKRQKEEKKEAKKEKPKQPMTCALVFSSFDKVVKMCHACFQERIPESSLYKLEGEYFLVMDFSNFAKEEMRTFAFAAVEYDDGRFSNEGQIAYIVEHGQSIVRKEAIQTLMAL